MGSTAANTAGAQPIPGAVESSWRGRPASHLPAPPPVYQHHPPHHLRPMQHPFCRCRPASHWHRPPLAPRTLRSPPSTLLPALLDLEPPAAGDIPRGRVHTAPGGDTLRVRGQDSGPRRRRTPPTAQKCPRRRRTSPLGASGPMGRRIPTGPATSAATPPGPAPSCADTGNRPDITTFTIRRTPTADTDNFLHYTSRRRTTQIEPRRRSTPTTRRAPPTP